MSASGFDFQKYLQIVVQRKRLFIVVALSIMTLAVFVSYILPKRYEARSTVFVEQSVISDLVRGIAVTPSMEAKIRVMNVTMLSRTMLLQVIKDLDKDLGVSQGAEQEALIKSLRERTSITLNEKQGVFVIAFRDSNPRFARDFVNTLTQRYIEQNTSSKREESLEATRFLAEQIEVFKKRIDAADNDINKFKSEKGMILSMDEGAIRMEIVGAEKKLEDLSLRRNELEAKMNLARSPRGGRRGELQHRLDALLVTYTENHPKVVRLRNEINNLKHGRDDDEKAASNAVSGLMQVEMDAIKEMERRQLQIIDENKALLREIPTIKAQLVELQHKKDNESLIYNQLVSRYGQSEVSKQMELQDKSVSFKILDPAVTPEMPVSPNRFQIILAGILLGLVGGFGFVYGLDFLRRSIKSLEEVRTLGMPVFAIIPKITNLADEERRRQQDRSLYMAASVYFSVILLFLTVEALRLTPLGASLGEMVGKVF